MSADLPQLRILRYAPPLTMLSYPIPLSSLSISLQRHLPSDPPSFLSLSLSFYLSPLYRPVFRVYLSSSSPFFPFFPFKASPLHSTSIPFSPSPFLDPMTRFTPRIRENERQNEISSEMERLF